MVPQKVITFREPLSSELQLMETLAICDPIVCSLICICVISYSYYEVDSFNS